MSAPAQPVRPTRAALPGGDWLLPAAALGAGVIGLIGYIVLSARVPVGPTLAGPVALAAVFGGIAVLGVALIDLRLLLAGMFAVVFLSPAPTEEFHISAGFMKVYLTDLMVALGLVVVAWRASLGWTQRRPHPWNTLVLAYLGLGVFALVVGLFLRGHEFANVFGDFRRAFFYFAAFFLLTTHLLESPRDEKFLFRLLLAGSAVLVLKGVYQIATGQFYRLHPTDAAHILSHYELTFLSFGVFYALARLVLQGVRGNGFMALLFGLGTMVTIVGNFRASWLSFIGGALLILLFLPRRQIANILLIGASLAAALVITVALLWEVRIAGESTVGEEIAAKARIGDARQDTNVQWRFQSYARAFEQFAAAPILGQGVGTLHEFSAPTTTGSAALAIGNRVHNSLLWLLMSLGVFGFAASAYVLFRLGWDQVRCLRSGNLPAEDRPLLLATAAFYLGFIVSTCFEIFLESQATVTVLVVVLALAALTMRRAARDSGAAGRPGNA